MMKSVQTGLFLFFLIFLSGYQLYAQSKTITGRVTSQESGQPLSGVTITEKGKTNTVLSKTDGTFSIVVANTTATLTFSFVGYADQEKPVGTAANINIVLSTSTPKLDEVVVIGYGTVKRRDLTGSVASIKSTDIMRTPTFNAGEALQGRVPGLDVTRSTGAAGSSANIRVRGNRSLPGTFNSPLFIIDGFQGGNISDLDPNDIENIDVLKDASATAIYGALGANGVIIITTKKGIAGKTTVSYSGFYGVNGYTAYPEPRLGDSYVQLRREAYRSVGEWNSAADDYKLFPDASQAAAVAAGQWVNWYDLVNRNGQQQSHSVSVRSGTEKTKIYFSLGYYREEGMLRRNDYTRYNMRFNLDQTLTRWARAGIQSQVAYYKQNNRTDPISAISSAVPLGIPYDSFGLPRLYPIPNNNIQLSPIYDDRGDTVAINNTIRGNLISSAYLEINPVKGLTFRTNLGLNFNFSRQGIYNSANSLAQRNVRLNQANVNYSFPRYLNWDNILTYNTNFGDHALTVTAIESYVQTDLDNLNSNGIKQLLSSQLFYNLGATEPTTRGLGSGYQGSNNLSFAGRINYSYKGKYLLTVSERADGASRLSPGNKWNYFPSIAGAWNISSEKFMEGVKPVSNLKLRASYGVAGNYGIDIYGTQSTIVAGTNQGFGDVQAPYYQFSPRVGNPNLKWERTATVNLALDFGLLNNRLTGTIDAYRGITSDLILNRTLPLSTGVTSVYQNVGKTQNKGIEIALTSTNIRNRNFNWNTTLTFSRNKEQIKELINGNIISSVNPEDSSLLIGYPIQSYYSYRKLGIWQLDKAGIAARYRFGTSPFRPGDPQFEDINGDSVINTNDRQYLGSSVPKFVLGLQNNFSYKGFDLGVYIFMRWGQTAKAEFLGRYNPSGEGNGPAEFDYWTPENPTNDFPRPYKGSQFINIYGYQGLYYVDASYLKIKTVTLGYTFNKKLSGKVGASSIRFYATGNNIFTFAKSHYFKNYDPERGGTEASPISRQFVFGINADF